MTPAPRDLLTVAEHVGASVTGPASLTARQRECLTAYGRLGSVKAVAHELGIAPRTVIWHLAAARERLDVDALVQAVLALAEAAIAAPAPIDGLCPGEPQGNLSLEMLTTGHALHALRAARIRAGLTQDRLAERLGLCRQRVSAAECALRVSPAFAARYAAALEIGG